MHSVCKLFNKYDEKYSVIPRITGSPKPSHFTKKISFSERFHTKLRAITQITSCLFTLTTRIFEGKLFILCRVGKTLFSPFCVIPLK